MKDCTTCPHSVQNNPANLNKKWEDLPCATCEAVEPFGRNVSFDEAYHSLSSHFDYDAIDGGDKQKQTLLDLLGEIMRFYALMTERERQVFMLRMAHPEMEHAKLAAQIGISRVRLYKIYGNIRKRHRIFEIII
jgi:DNA-directed RNA polymerase specialized sigma subunit